METYTIGKTEMLCLMAMVEHWYAGWSLFRRMRMDLYTGKQVVEFSNVPSWVTVVVRVVNNTTGSTFDYMSGRWSAEKDS